MYTTQLTLCASMDNIMHTYTHRMYMYMYMYVQCHVHVHVSVTHDVRAQSC